jgi:hypothetical protein
VNLTANKQTNKFQMSSILTNANTPKRVPPRVRFDEEGIAVDYAERGVLYGTQKIDQVDTPFIYYDSEEDDYSSNIMVAEYAPDGEPQKMMASELQAKLGLLAQQQQQEQQEQERKQENGETNEKTPVKEPKKWEQVERRMDFESKRRMLYAQEGNTFARGTLPNDVQEGDDDLLLPSGWVIMKSRTDGAKFYYHAGSNTTQWERPE